MYVLVSEKNSSQMFQGQISNVNHVMSNDGEIRNINIVTREGSVVSGFAVLSTMLGISL